jgi:hypothetical protein
MLRTCSASAVLFSLLLAAVTPATAQPCGGSGGSPESTRELLISTDDPSHHRAVNAWLRHPSGEVKCEKLRHTRSEAWTGPQTDFDRLKQVQLGTKFDLVRDEGNHILKGNEAPMLPAQKDILTRAGRSSKTVGTMLMRLPEAAVAEYALTGGPDGETSRLVIPVSDDRQITIIRSSTSRTEKGVIWRGTVADTGESAVLQWWKDGRLTGLFSYRGHIFTVMNAGGNLHAVLEANPQMMPPDHPKTDMEPNLEEAGAPPSFEAAHLDVVPLSEAQFKALQANAVVIDVMMLYTSRAAAHYMRSPEDVLEFAIERVNDTFRNSGINNIRLRLVHTAAVAYDEWGSEEFIDLYRMVDGEGPFQGVRRLRDEKRADIVGLVVDDPRGCGLSTRVAPDAEEAFFVVHYACAAISISIAHEIGHILGARHDRRSDPNNTPFPYAHGYVSGTMWRDIMSYPESCNGCPRIPFWSNPRILYKGEPTGTVTEDNARVILEQAERVSHFR